MPISNVTSFFSTMQIVRKRNSDARSTGSTPVRSSLADAAWAVEDRVVWGAADRLRTVADVIRRPFERIAWSAEHRVVWPIQEEAALWSAPVRAAALAAAILLACAGVVAGVVVSDPSSGGDTAVEASAGTSPTVLPVDPPVQPAPDPGAPVRKGAAPDFAPEAGGGVPKAEAGADVAAAAAEAAAGTAAGTASAASADSGPGALPPVAGPGAVAVAHKFSSAFVLYETGRDGPGVRQVLQQTATPDLVQALLQRPPRLPANVDVPRAKVLNVVPGPLQGDTYTLSVSLLRVGVTSELRLDMKLTPVAAADDAGPNGEPERSKWVVTDVLG